MQSPPVLFLIFNRPDTTREVFETIRRQKPTLLFVAADGPRTNVPDDVALCNAARSIISKVDWECEVKTLFSEKNMGCGLAPATGITWFFEHVDEGIILEDDCIPNDSFFEYCGTLLGRYRDSEEVMMICGTSYQPRPLNRDTYYFSKYPHVWGWASWKRAWAGYNFVLDAEPEAARTAVIKATFKNSREQQFWENNFRMIIKGLDAWDYQWMYWVWKKGGVCVVPWQNLVANIGFGSHGTHTLDRSSSQAQMAQFDIPVIRHPRRIVINRKADIYERNQILVGSDLTYYLRKIRSAAGRVIKPILYKNGR